MIQILELSDTAKSRLKKAAAVAGAAGLAAGAYKMGKGRKAKTVYRVIKKAGPKKAVAKKVVKKAADKPISASKVISKPTPAPKPAPKVGPDKAKADAAAKKAQELIKALKAAPPKKTVLPMSPKSRKLFYGKEHRIRLRDFVENLVLNYGQ